MRFDILSLTWALTSNGLVVRITKGISRVRGRRDLGPVQWVEQRTPYIATSFSIKNGTNNARTVKDLSWVGLYNSYRYD